MNSFGSRRLLIESFRLTFSLMHEPPKYHILLEDNDLNDRSVARQYDQALLKLLRESGNNKELLSAKLNQYPVKAENCFGKTGASRFLELTGRLNLITKFFMIYRITSLNTAH